MLPKDMPCEVVPYDWARQPSCHYTIGMTTDLVELLRKTIKDGVPGNRGDLRNRLDEEMAYLTELALALSPTRRLHRGHAALGLPRGPIPPSTCHRPPGRRFRKNLVQGVMVCFQDQLFAASEVRKVHSSRASI